MSAKYQPINCHFYDELELLAIRQKPCLIVYKNENSQEVSRTDIILDFKIIDKAEYMILKSGEKIRLDRIIKVDNKQALGYC